MILRMFSIIVFLVSFKDDIFFEELYRFIFFFFCQNYTALINHSNNDNYEKKKKKHSTGQVWLYTQNVIYRKIEEFIAMDS